jgi:hypothetical protein
MLRIFGPPQAEGQDLMDKLHGEEVYVHVLFITCNQNAFHVFFLFVLTPCGVVGGLHPLRGIL